MDKSALEEKFKYLAEADALKSVPAATYRQISALHESVADQRWHMALTALVYGPNLADPGTVDGAILQLLLGKVSTDLRVKTMPLSVARRVEPLLDTKTFTLAQTLTSLYGMVACAPADRKIDPNNLKCGQTETNFLYECDKLKDVMRATRLHDNSRHENSGEHSFHVALYALLLEDYAKDPVDIMHVIRMLLVHDIVEIDAGDTPIHAALDPKDQETRERAAASRIFGILPKEKADYVTALWSEFEANETPEAQFAKSIDRVPPICANLANGGGSWADYDVTYEQLVERVGAKMSKGAPALWEHLDTKIRAFPWFAGQLA